VSERCIELCPVRLGPDEVSSGACSASRSGLRSNVDSVAMLFGRILYLVKINTFFLGLAAGFPCFASNILILINKSHAVPVCVCVCLCVMAKQFKEVFIYCKHVNMSNSSMFPQSVKLMHER